MPQEPRLSDLRPAIPPLTSLRFFAALVVVTFHYDPSRFDSLPDFLQNWLETGYEAVTFFFVLSGFILAYVNSADLPGGRPTTLRAFFLARFGRLFPAYYTGLLIALPFFIADAFIWGSQPVGEFALNAALVLTGLQSWWPPSALAWNPPSWSLSVEWFLYATFPLALFAAQRIPARWLLPGAYLLVLATSCFRVLVLAPLVTDDIDAWGNFAAYFPLWHLPTFLFGIALGRLHLLGHRPRPGWAAAMSLAGLAGLAVLLGGFTEVPEWMLADAILVILFGALIFGAAQPGHPLYRLLCFAPLPYLGEISFSIYVLHEPVAFWWEAIGPSLLGEPERTWIDFPIYAALVFAAAALSFRYIETPLRRRIRRW